jgi:thiol-disulfide isomerase/thioredoxin
MKLKFTIEKTIHLVLALAFLVLITASNLWIFNGKIVRILLLYTGVFAWIIVFYSQSFWLFPKYFLNKRCKFYFLFAFAISFGLFLIHSILLTLDFQEQGIRKHHLYWSFSKTYFHFYKVHLEWWGEILIVFLVSLGYSYIKVLLQRGRLKVKTLIISACIVLALISGLITGFYFFKTSYRGDEQIIFMNQSDKINSIEDLIKQKEFKGKVLYIDIWGPNCGPCIHEFKNLKNLKERYNNGHVKFIYLSFIKKAFIKRSADTAKWKSIIKEYEISGYHMYIDAEFYESIWKIKGIRDLYGIPHYLIIDKNGNIANANAERPSSGEKLYQQLDNVLHQ